MSWRLRCLSKEFSKENTVRADNDKLALAMKYARRTVLFSATTVAAAGVHAAERVEEIIVSDRMPARYTLEQSSLSKLTESLQNTPQSISVITGQLMEDRAVMSLNDALRNVPGITLGAGEFSWQGNNPNIRGFNSRNDMFLDGMRDFGNYDRDPFNLDNIEVLQGRAQTSGAGAVIGAVVGGVLGNQVGKGSGRAAATGVGILGGAVAGNAIEGRNNGQDVQGYRLSVQLDQGGYRVYDVPSPGDLRIGDRVRLYNGQITRM